uniref:Uncharacterized protein n=1 Tax=Romanomermis culicivorax TaxID=13658 RepID=A0A915KKD4_ROMCU
MVKEFQQGHCYWQLPHSPKTLLTAALALLKDIENMEAGRAPWSKPTESEVPAGTDDLNRNRPQGSRRHDLSDKSRLSDRRSWTEIIADDENSEKFDEPREGNLDRNSNSACIDLEEDPAHDDHHTLKDQEHLKMSEITAYLNFNDYKFLQTRSTLEIIREYVKEN